MAILRDVFCPIRLATISEDKKQNTDLVMMKADDATISCRMRRYQYLHMFGDQFTFRKTEVAKMLAGYGDLFFYGFADLYGHEIERWAILDLDHLRILLKNLALEPIATKGNRDGSPDFIAFRFADVPVDVFKATSPGFWEWLEGPIHAMPGQDATLSFSRFRPLPERFFRQQMASYQEDVAAAVGRILDGRYIQGWDLSGITRDQVKALKQAVAGKKI
jgi:hypothetical protein